MIKELNIVKIGGNILNTPALLKQYLKDFSQLKGYKILVHGGGKKANEVCHQMNIIPKMKEGRRITDEATLEIVTMVYAGLINKKIVSQLQALNCKTIGLSGADGNVIYATKRPVVEIDYGFAGDIQTINKELIIKLLNQKLSLAFCSITHNGKGQLLNTNADTIATQLAIVLADDYEIKLQFQFGQKGVLKDANNANSFFENLSQKQYQAHKKTGIINEGMVPKLDNAFQAKHAGVQQINIGETKIV